MSSTQHRKARGMRTQLLTTDYLKVNGWPFATSAGAGRPGVDVLNTPDIAVEVKARTDLNPLAWVRQAQAAAAGRLPFVVFRPNGMGEHPEDFIAFLRLSDLVAVLRAAGYGDASEPAYEDDGCECGQYGAHLTGCPAPDAGEFDRTFAAGTTLEGAGEPDQCKAAKDAGSCGQCHDHFGRHKRCPAPAEEAS